MAADRQRRITATVLRPFALSLFFTGWLLSASAWCETLYVSDTTLEANLRTGTNWENRIIAVVTPGTKVTLVDEADGWAEVTLEDGRTGWILKKYLSERPPWRLTAQKLEGENKELRTRLSQIERQHGELVERNTQLEKQVDKLQRELQTVRQEYEDLKKSAANYLNLKMAYENLQTDARQSKSRLEELQDAYGKLKLSTNVRWFLSGAGVLLLGWLVGLSMGRMRRRRSAELYKL